MLLTNSNNIKEVMLFPAMKPNDSSAAQAGAAKGGSTQEKVKLVSTEGSTDTHLPQIVGNFAGSQIEVSTVKKEDLMKDKAILAKNPAGSVPYLQTASGDVITELSAISLHLARMNSGSGLLGASSF